MKSRFWFLDYLVRCFKNYTVVETIHNLRDCSSWNRVGG